MYFDKIMNNLLKYDSNSLFCTFYNNFIMLIYNYYDYHIFLTFISLEEFILAEKVRWLVTRYLAGLIFAEQQVNNPI